MHMRASFLVWPVLFAVVATRFAPGQQGPMLNPNRATVLPPETAPSVVRQCTRLGVPVRIQGTWQPTEEQISTLERVLAPALDRGLKTAEDERAHELRVNDYYRQYAGLVVDGRQIIYVNGFHRGFLQDLARGDTTSWRKEPVNVCDGGEWFFGAEYDVSSGRIRSLHFSGHA